MNILRSMLSRLRPAQSAAGLDLASFNPLGKTAADGRTPAEERAAENIKEQTAEVITRIDQACHRQREKYRRAPMTDADANAVLATFPAVDFGECTHFLSLSDQASLTEEKQLLVIPLLEQLGRLRTYGEEQRVSQAEFIGLKRMLLDALLGLFSSPTQLPTFDWTIERLKELEMIPAHFEFRDMEHYCALGRWG